MKLKFMKLESSGQSWRVALDLSNYTYPNELHLNETRNILLIIFIGSIIKSGPEWSNR